MIAALPHPPRPLLANMVLDALAPGDLDQLMPHLRLVELRSDHERPLGLSSYDVLFPQTCLLSLMGTTAEGSTLDVATVGFQGYTALPCGENSGTPLRYYVRHSGTALSADSRVLDRLQDASPFMRRAFANHQHTFATEIATSALCNGLHQIRERCVRTLLQHRERVRGERLRLSHDVLANMVGVRRASISAEMHKLRRAGYIRYHRGSIEIVDYRSLQLCACSCYQPSRTTT